MEHISHGKKKKKPGIFIGISLSKGNARNFGQKKKKNKT